MNTHIRNHSDRTDAGDGSDVSTVYPAPSDLTIEQIVTKALLKNIPLFLVTLCLIMMMA